MQKFNKSLNQVNRNEKMLALSHMLSESNDPKLQQLRFEIHDF